MYAYLKGKLVFKSPAVVHMDVNGIGFEINISLNTYSKLQTLEEACLFVHFQVKEDAHNLFGFFDREEKEVFVQLLGVSGVGAATARLMLSNLKPDEVCAAIAEGNVRLLESVKGIGKKTAERLVLELRDKVRKIAPETAIQGGWQGNSLTADALNALIALGISRPVAENAIRKTVQAEPTINHLELLIKKALKAI
jgi:Holliday junction DNA helicase RuvA